MQGDNVQKRLNNVRNEVKALKVASEVYYGALQFPDDTPTATISGSVQPSATTWALSTWRARFTREDGKITTPFVDFAWDYSYTPTNKEYMQSIGYTIESADFEAPSWASSVGQIESIGNGYVDFFIYIYTEDRAPSVELTITVQAISTAKGRLTIERVS